MIDPTTGLLIGLVTGIGGVVTYVVYKAAEEAGPQLSLGDLLPAAPWEGPPVPRFVVTKPHLVRQLANLGSA